MSQAYTFLFFRWGNFYDHESELSHCEVCLGKSQGECDEIDYILIGLNSTYEFNDLKLGHKDVYYVTIKISNVVGLSSQMASIGVEIDLTPPEPVKHMSGSSSNEVSSGNFPRVLKWVFLLHVCRRQSWPT